MSLTFHLVARVQYNYILQLKCVFLFDLFIFPVGGPVRVDDLDTEIITREYYS